MKKRVLFFCNGLYGGGAEKVLQVVLKHLSPNKYDITLYSLRKEEKRDVYPFNRIKYRYIYNQYAEDDSFLKRISIKLINKIKLWIYYHLSPSVFYRLFVRGIYDVEVAFIEGEATRIISGSPNKKSRKLAWVHIDLESNHWTKCSYRKNEECVCYTRFDGVYCVSESVKGVFQRLFPSVRYVDICYNPIDVSDIKKKSQEQICFNKGKGVRLFSVGRLVHQKGYDRLLSVMNRLVKDNYCVSLTIVGDGDDRDALNLYIRQHGLCNNVRLLGRRDNPYPYYLQADWFVCSSRAEGYSLVIAEAIVLGVPVISTYCSGPNELLGEGEYGILVDNTENALFEGIKNVLINQELKTFYAKKSLYRGENLFHTSNPVEKLEELLT